MDYTDDYFKWIGEHENDNPNALRLKYAHKQSDAIDYGSAIVQIECRKKFRSKLEDTLGRIPRFVFPSVLAGEQSTSDLLADFHASLITENSNVIDLTAGLGIDVLHFAEKAKFVEAIELDSSRADALVANLKNSRTHNVLVFKGDCREYLKRAIADSIHFDFAFIDPARRSEQGKRLYALSDCQPDVVGMLADISKITDKLIIKASPMLDITHCIRTLGTATTRIFALGTRTECKELLIELDFRQSTEVPSIHAVTILKDSISCFEFTIPEEISGIKSDGRVILKAGDYVYEPYPAVMKTGAFNVLSHSFGLSIISSNTRLLYSDKRIENFPGSLYEVVEILPFASKVIKRLNKSYPKASIATRNFGMTGDALRDRLKIKEGELFRIYGISDSDNNKQLLITKRV